MIIKQGDIFPIDLEVNYDLTEATTRLVVRHLSRGGDREDLPHTVVGGTVTFVVDGTWEVGAHYLELKIIEGEELRTAPSQDKFLKIAVAADLD